MASTSNPRPSRKPPVSWSPYHLALNPSSISIRMAGSIAGAFYGIDDSLVEEALERIDDDEMLKTIAAFAETVEKKE